MNTNKGKEIKDKIRSLLPLSFPSPSPTFCLSLTRRNFSRSNSNEQRTRGQAAGADVRRGAAETESRVAFGCLLEVGFFSVN